MSFRRACEYTKDHANAGGADLSDDMQSILDWCLHQSWRLGSPPIPLAMALVLLEVQVVL